MKVEKNQLTKLCSFYVSEWHLVTMLLPYLNEKVKEEAKIAIVFEKDITENLITLLEKLNLKNKEKILNLSWKEKDEIKTKINELKENQELVIFINGTKEFIEKQNIKLTRYFETHLIKHPIKIVNCYEVLAFDGSIEQVLEQHDKVLNTSGEREIAEIFPNFQKTTYTQEKAVVGLE